MVNSYDNEDNVKDFKGKIRLQFSWVVYFLFEHYTTPWQPLERMLITFQGCRYQLLFCHQVMSDSLRPHGLQHTRLPVLHYLLICPDSCPLSRWCHPTILPSAIPFSSFSQSFRVPGFFPMIWLLASGGQSIGASASASVVAQMVGDRDGVKHSFLLLTEVPKPLSQYPQIIIASLRLNSPHIILFYFFLFLVACHFLSQIYASTEESGT